MTESERVTLKELAEATVQVPRPDQRATDEQAQFDHKERMQETQLGWVGKIWGSRSEKPGNISAIVALILVLYIGGLLATALFSPNVSFSDVSDALAGVTSIVTLILGYLFGSNDRR